MANSNEKNVSSLGNKLKYLLIGGLTWLIIRTIISGLDNTFLTTLFILVLWALVVWYVISPIKQVNNEVKETFSSLKWFILIVTFIFMLYFLAIAIFTSKDFISLILNFVWVGLLVSSLVLMISKLKKIRGA